MSSWGRGKGRASGIWGSKFEEPHSWSLKCEGKGLGAIEEGLNGKGCAGGVEGLGTSPEGLYSPEPAECSSLGQKGLFRTWQSQEHSL